MNIKSTTCAVLLAALATGAAAAEFERLPGVQEAGPQPSLPLTAADAAVEAKVQAQLSVIDSVMSAQLASYPSYGTRSGTTVVTALSSGQR